MVNIYPACYCAARVMGRAGAGRQRIQSEKYKMYGNTASSETDCFFFFLSFFSCINFFCFLQDKCFHGAATSSSLGLVLIFQNQVLLFLSSRQPQSTDFYFFSVPSPDL